MSISRRVSKLEEQARAAGPLQCRVCGNGEASWNCIPEMVFVYSDSPPPPDPPVCATCGRPRNRIIVQFLGLEKGGQATGGTEPQMIDAV